MRTVAAIFRRARPRRRARAHGFRRRSIRAEAGRRREAKRPGPSASRPARRCSQHRENHPNHPARRRCGPSALQQCGKSDAVHLSSRSGGDLSPLVRADPRGGGSRRASRGRCSPLAVRLAHAAGDTRDPRRPRLVARRRRRGAQGARGGAPILVDSAMVRGRDQRDRLPAGNASSAPCAIPTPRTLAAELGTTRSAAAVELWRPASRRRGRGDRQRADRAVSSARDPRGRGAADRRWCSAFRSGLSAPPRRRRRCRIRRGLEFIALQRTARRQRARRGGGQRARRRRADEPLARRSSASARTGSPVSPGGAHAGRDRRDPGRRRAASRDGAAGRRRAHPSGGSPLAGRSRRSPRTRAGGSRCWRAATRCGTASAPCSPATSRARR